MLDKPTPSTPVKIRFGAIIAAVIVGVVIGTAGIYGIGGHKRNDEAARNAADRVCQGTLARTERLKPLVRGEIAALALASRPLQLPDLTFRGPAGEAKKLSDFRGHTILLNLWATWCVPCRKEMPALDALQGALGGDRFAVVAVNIDTRDPQRPRDWLKEAGISRLTYYHDEKAEIFQDLKSIGKAFGMPTTLLVDGEGCEIGTLAGPAEWAGEDARKLIEAAIAARP